MDLMLRRRQMMSIQSSPTPPFPQDAYLTFVAKVANSSVSMKKHGEAPTVSLEYSLDGNTWNTYNFGEVIQLNDVGSWVKFKGVNSAFAGGNSIYNYFVMTGEIDAYGDLTSILNGVGGDYTPQIRGCLYLFSGCISLRRAPDLPTTILGNRQYYWMFHGCTNLNYIKTSMTNVSANQCLNSWVSGVGSTGTFVCPSSLTITSGGSGIPSGWTRVDL